MRMLIALFFLSLFTSLAYGETQREVGGFAAKRLLYALELEFENFHEQVYLDDLCTSSWYADEVYGFRIDENYFEIWANVYKGRQRFTSEHIDGTAVVRALRNADIVFGTGSGNAIHDLKCTRLKNGIPGCSNQTGNDIFKCSLSIGDAG